MGRGRGERTRIPHPNLKLETRILARGGRRSGGKQTSLLQAEKTGSRKIFQLVEQALYEVWVILAA
jgi:hypothetical protein